jgi:hypothetical protein
MERIKLIDLKESPLNADLRLITSKKYVQLKKDLTRDGQLNNLLIMKDEDKWIVIDGNHRYKAMTEMGWYEARCDRVEFVNEEKEGWYAIIEGEEQRTQYFRTKEQALMWYSLKRNDPGYAVYNKEKVMEYMEFHNIPAEEVNILVEEVPSFNEVINASVNQDKIEMEEKAVNKKPKEIDIICPHCGKSFKKEV